MLIRIHIPFRSIWSHFRVFLPSLCCPVICCFYYLKFHISLILHRLLGLRLKKHSFKFGNFTYFTIVVSYFIFLLYRSNILLKETCSCFLPLLIKQNGRTVLPPIIRYLLNRLNPIYVVFPSFFVITNNLIYKHFTDPGCSW